MYRLIDNEQLSNFGNEDAYSFIGRRIFLLFPQCYWIITSLFQLKKQIRLITVQCIAKTSLVQNYLFNKLELTSVLAAGDTYHTVTQSRSMKVKMKIIEIV